MRTGREREALRALRDRYYEVVFELDEYRQNDEVLLRFLKARDMDVEKAGEMLRKFVSWRATNDIDNIRSRQLPEVFENSLPFYPCGFDKEGCPVGVIPFGHWNLRRCIEGGHGKDFVTYATQLFEQVTDFCKVKSEEDGLSTVFTKVNVIIDYKGFSPFSLASREVVEALMEALKIFEANYPETLKACWVINTSAVFQIVYNLVSPLMSKQTLSKVHIFGGNEKEWKASILSAVDADQMYSAYGGSITTVFPYKMKYGFEVFPLYDTLADEDFATVTVSAGGNFKFPIFDCTLGEKITWNFRTEDFNIEFSVVEAGKDGGAEAVMVEPMRVDAHEVTQVGAVMVRKRGVYTLVFNNSYSKFRSKKLHYAVRRDTSL